MKIDSEVFLFGCGFLGRQLKKLLEGNGYSIIAFIDNDAEKQGRIVDGCLVISASEFAKRREKSCILITPCCDCSGIVEQMIALGVDRGRIVTRDDIIKDLDLSWIYEDVKEKSNHFKPVLDKDGLSVLLDGQIFWMQKRGGISRYFYEIANEMTRINGAHIDLFKGISISEIMFDNKNLDGERYSYPLNEIMLYDYPIRTKCNRQLLHYFCELSDKYDIYHPTYYENMHISCYKRKVVTVHDMIHERFALDKDTIHLKRQMVEGADGIIAVSENTKKDLIEILGVKEERIQVIYHGNSLNMEVGKDRLINEPYILYVGNRDKYKNFAILAQAYSKSSINNEVKLVCFGGGDFTDEEKDMFVTLNISDKVRICFGDDTRLANVYAYAELFIYPSLYEGFGIPLLEAMHYKTPIIASNVSSIPEVGKDAVEYFDPNSEEELRYKLESLLYDEKRKITLIEKGLLREKDFSWKKTAGETYSFYKRIL